MSFQEDGPELVETPGGGLEARRYKIVSDGTPAGTMVFDPQGERMLGVIGVEWSINANERAVLKIELLHSSVDLTAADGELARVEVNADDESEEDDT